jgi:hypothetical protein
MDVVFFSVRVARVVCAVRFVLRVRVGPLFEAIRFGLRPASSVRKADAGDTEGRLQVSPDIWVSSGTPTPMMRGPACFSRNLLVLGASFIKDIPKHPHPQ